MNVVSNREMCREVARFRRKLARMECVERRWRNENEDETLGSGCLKFRAFRPMI